MPDPRPKPLPRSTEDSLPLALRIVELSRDMRAEEPVLLDVRELVDYTDFFLLLTGRSSRQNQAIGEHIVKSLKTGGLYAISKAGLESGSWICLDMGDVVVHVFDPPTRDRYDLELLWADAPRIEIPPPKAGIPAPAAEPEALEAEEEAPAKAAAKAKAPAKKRRRVVRSAAVEDADAANAPDAERPPDDEAEAPEALPLAKKAKAKAKAPKAPSLTKRVQLATQPSALAVPTKSAATKARRSRKRP